MGSNVIGGGKRQRKKWRGADMKQCHCRLQEVMKLEFGRQPSWWQEEAMMSGAMGINLFRGHGKQQNQRLGGNTV